jgi:hypothetical protein
MDIYMQGTWVTTDSRTRDSTSSIMATVTIIAPKSVCLYI